MSESASGGGGFDADLVGAFIPKPDLLQVLTNMGISRNAATKGLYHTGNYNADLAAAWIFENQDKDLDNPLLLGEDDDSSEDEMEEFLDESDFYKMVFVVNQSLGMGVGKVAAQVAHGALGLYRVLVEDHNKYGGPLMAWESFGETKIVTKGENGEHLQELQAKAASLDIPHYQVHDAGKTQIAAGSNTVLALFGKLDIVDKITGSLQLL
ncbi:unnamed protein product [Owenia fusiformis]|uniref:peptidyl-tRNA hydrolase n=1 Tax=Owenia fusiformis TaxID=6347 RepID=A0A8J1TQM2_OWEFU|nr:unnamed protein product [Owenia fusiformis]